MNDSAKAYRAVHLRGEITSSDGASPLPLRERCERISGGGERLQLTRHLAPRYRSVMSFYRYLDDCDVHVLDCAGKVDVPAGLARLRRLSQELDARPARDGVHRLLIDFRQTEWASEDAHRELSRATRRDFGLNAENPSLRLAFVFHRGEGVVSNSEHWFVDDAEALAWLTSHRTVDAE